jgi:uroporphyrinogen-III synthase
MAGFGGRRIALLEARMSDEVAALVRRLGGNPDSVPAVREVVRPGEAGPFLDALLAGRLSIVIFLTGAGASALLREAARLERLDATLNALRSATIICRGPKPVAVMRRHEVPVHVTAAEPFTTQDLLRALEPIALEHTRVGLVHYGEKNVALSTALAARGAQLEELFLYEWELPEDVDGLKRLVGEIIGGRVDAVAFTSQIQCRHLFKIADDLGESARLAQSLNADVIVAAVGPVCAEALQALGVTPDVIPSRPKMGPMIAALAEYFELTEDLPEEGPAVNPL